MRIAFYTFGCTVNQYETQKIRSLFIENGDEIVEEGIADVYIINSCAITKSAEKGILQLVIRLKKKNPSAIIVVVGCIVELYKKDNRAEIPGADLLVDNRKMNIVSQVCRLCSDGVQGNQKTKAASPALTSGPGRIFLELQKGCDNCCTFCIVPHVRGRSLSKPFSEYREELDCYTAQGYQEIILAGLNLGLYHDGGHTLLDAIQYANSHEGVKSIRLSSLEPMHVDHAFIDALPAMTKLNPHLHISLQSGSDHILKLMRRNYAFEEYLAMITRIRERVPGIAISTDIIVGFPGESESDFQESIQNIIRCSFSDIHIFKYSRRPQTPAAAMKNQVTDHQKSKRALLMKGIKFQARYQFMKEFIGKHEPVILLERQHGDWLEGVTAHNIPIRVQSTAPVDLGLYYAKITGINSRQDLLYGTLVKD